MKPALLLIAALTLTACAEVVSEQPTTFEYRATTYQAVIREYSTDTGSYKRRSIRVGAASVTCSATDDLDCAAAIRAVKDRPFDR